MRFHEEAIATAAAAAAAAAAATAAAAAAAAAATSWGEVELNIFNPIDRYLTRPDQIRSDRAGRQ